MRRSETNSKICTNLFRYEACLSSIYVMTKSGQACDSVLKSVEVSLAGFQKDLGIVSMEIETLQTKSAALNTRLENRKRVERILGPAVEEVSISPVVVQCVSNGQMDENWLKALAELQKRLKVIEGKAGGTESIKAASDIKPLLDSLTTKVRYLDSALRDLLMKIIGRRANKRLPGCANKSYQIAQYERANHSATKSGQIQRSIHLSV